MKNYFLILLISLAFFSCDQHILDKPFYPDSYKTDFVNLMGDTLLSQNDLLVINYSILRHRDYFDYEVEGQSYLDILKKARAIQKEGSDIVETYDEVNFPPEISIKISGISMAILPKKNRPSRKVKNLKFSCAFTNTSAQDIALNFATFIVKGPLGFHLVTAGYETNCKIPAFQTQTIHYVVSSRQIRSSLFFEKSNEVKRLMIDDLLPALQVEVGGIEIDKEAQNYPQCYGVRGVNEPFMHSKYKELFPDGIKPEEIAGKPTIHYGSKLFKRAETDEILEYRKQ